MSRLSAMSGFCGILLSASCVAREFTPCQIADSRIRSTISRDVVITVHGRVSPTMHRGVFLHDHACDGDSIELGGLGADKNMSAAVDAILTEEMYVRPHLVLTTGRPRCVGTIDLLETTSVRMGSSPPKP